MLLTLHDFVLFEFVDESYPCTGFTFMYSPNLCQFFIWFCHLLAQGPISVTNGDAMTRLKRCNIIVPAVLNNDRDSSRKITNGSFRLQIYHMCVTSILLVFLVDFIYGLVALVKRRITGYPNLPTSSTTDLSFYIISRWPHSWFCESGERDEQLLSSGNLMDLQSNRNSLELIFNDFM